MAKGTLTPRGSAQNTNANQMSKFSNDPMTASPGTVRSIAQAHSAGMPHAASFKNAPPADKGRSNLSNPPITPMPKPDNSQPSPGPQATPRRSAFDALGPGAQLGGAR